MLLFAKKQVEQRADFLRIRFTGVELLLEQEYRGGVALSDRFCSPSAAREVRAEEVRRKLQVILVRSQSRRMSALRCVSRYEDRRVAIRRILCRMRIQGGIRT